MVKVNINLSIENNKNWYSQYGEDQLLAQIFGRTAGLCVEVGANDGVKYSNTKHFEEIGWQCILVEPTPALCRKIRANRNGKLFECAASSAEGEMLLHVVEENDLFSSLEDCSTMAEDLYQNKSKIKSISVSVRPLDAMLSEAHAQSIDFVSIDVEGHEISVLGGFDLDRWRPCVVLIEDKSDLDVTEVERHMVQRGYRRFYRSGGNDWYAKSGRISAYFMLRMLASGRVTLRGLLKVWMPRTMLRLILLARRSLRMR
jgi:FkbM family methyltransferase